MDALPPGAGIVPRIEPSGRVCRAVRDETRRPSDLEAGNILARYAEPKL
jgi:hypothetical protein